MRATLAFVGLNEKCIKIFTSKLQNSQVKTYQKHGRRKDRKNTFILFHGFHHGRRTKKIEQNEPLEFVMLFNKRTKKEHIPTYKTLKHEINISD